MLTDAMSTLTITLVTSDGDARLHNLKRMIEDTCAERSASRQQAKRAARGRESVRDGATRGRKTLREWNGVMQQGAHASGGGGDGPHGDGDVRTRKDLDERLDVDRAGRLLGLTTGANPERLR